MKTDTSDTAPEANKRRAEGLSTANCYAFVVIRTIGYEGEYIEACFNNQLKALRFRDELRENEKKYSIYTFRVDKWKFGETKGEEVTL